MGVKRVKQVLELRSIFYNFFHNQATGGVILLSCAAIALIVANSPALSGVLSVWDTYLGIKVGTFEFKMSLLHWVNDGLMAIFFLVVGLEIKRELMVGELASLKKATLPIFAALGGMFVPALFYMLFNYGTESASGWGIPMATDIAFAVGIISVLGNRCPLSLKIFLTALAIVDDLGAILVLAIFYPAHEMSLLYLGVSGGITVLLFAFNRLGVRSVAAYMIPGVVLWYFVYMSGIHATIAGVILALMIPSKTSVNEVRFIVRMRYFLDQFRDASGRKIEVLANPEQLGAIHKMSVKLNKINPPMHKLEYALHPWVAFVIMPIFALANSAVVIDTSVLFAGGVPVLALGIFFGLLVGKPLGIFLFSYLAVKLKIAVLPSGTKWSQILALGVVAGIGFTMSIFIDNLAFSDPVMVDTGKVAILFTSFLAAIIGLVALYFTAPKVENNKKNESN